MHIWTKYIRMDQVKFFKGCLPQISKQTCSGLVSSVHIELGPGKTKAIPFQLSELHELSMNFLRDLFLKCLR